MDSSQAMMALLSNLIASNKPRSIASKYWNCKSQIQTRKKNQTKAFSHGSQACVVDLDQATTTSKV